MSSRLLIIILILVCSVFPKDNSTDKYYLMTVNQDTIVSNFVELNDSLVSYTSIHHNKTHKVNIDSIVYILTSENKLLYGKSPEKPPLSWRQFGMQTIGGSILGGAGLMGAFILGYVGSGPVSVIPLVFGITTGIWLGGSVGDQTGSYWETFKYTTAGTCFLVVSFVAVESDNDYVPLAITGIGMPPIGGLYGFNVSRQYKTIPAERSPLYKAEDDRAVKSKGLVFGLDACVIAGKVKYKDGGVKSVIGLSPLLGMGYKRYFKPLQKTQFQSYWNIGTDVFLPFISIGAYL